MHLTDVFAVEGYGADLVFAIADEEATERGFTCSRSCFDEVETAALEGDVLLPEVRAYVSALGKDARQGMVKSYGDQGDGVES